MVVGALDSAQASEVVCYDGFAISVMIERKAASLWRDRFGGLLSSTGSTETHHPKSASDSRKMPVYCCADDAINERIAARSAR